jgi:hypothetical protein
MLLLLHARERERLRVDVEAVVGASFGRMPPR